MPAIATTPECKLWIVERAQAGTVKGPPFLFLDCVWKADRRSPFNKAQKAKDKPPQAMFQFRVVHAWQFTSESADPL